MKPNEINILREAAVLLEHENLDIAHELMLMAQQFRPDGVLINAKIEEYRARMKKYQSRVYDLVQSGSLVILSSGFRCETKIRLSTELGLTQASLPFDSGFFPPSSIARLLKTRRVALQYPDLKKMTHQVCTKHEGVLRGNRRGIEFRNSSYDEINSLALDRDQSDINCLLDATFGYYTLDNKNGFVLAHYNWHNFASEKTSKGIRQPDINIPRINEVLNSRIDRMFKMCDSAERIIFVFGEFQNFDFMAVDDDVHDLHDLETIRDALMRAFGERACVVRFSEINTAAKLLSRIT